MQTTFCCESNGGKTLLRLLPLLSIGGREFTYYRIPIDWFASENPPLFKRKDTKILENSRPKSFPLILGSLETAKFTASKKSIRQKTYARTRHTNSARKLFFGKWGERSKKKELEARNGEWVVEVRSIKKGNGGESPAIFLCVALFNLNRSICVSIVARFSPSNFSFGFFRHEKLLVWIWYRYHKTEIIFWHWNT